MFRTLTRLAIFFLFSLSQAQACDVVDKRVCDIDAKLQAFSKGHAVVYKHESMDSPAEFEWMLNGPDYIYLDDTADLNDDELFFVVAHEFGHSVTKSGRRVLEHFAGPAGASLSDDELLKRFGDKFRHPESIPQSVNHDQEFTADEFACFAMRAYGKSCINAMYDALRISRPSHRHPSKADRISRVRSVLRQSNAMQYSMN